MLPKGIIELKTGNTYENNYISIFKLQEGKVIEYADYFDPVKMAKAFGIKLG